MTVISDVDPGRRPLRERRLVAVVHADVVGYSRLIGLDDAQTLKRLRILRRALISPTIRDFGGRVVSTGGDSMLVVFESIDNAVRCAVKIQTLVPTYDGDRPAEELIRYRIGVNLGDAIADGQDLHGESVNVAARLQAECPPGGVCISRAVRDHVHAKLSAEFKALGTLTLKNIARPVEAFFMRAGSVENEQPARKPEPVPDSAPPRKPPEFVRFAMTPVGIFFVCALLIEVVLGILAGSADAQQRADLVRTMAVLFVLVALVFAGLAWLRPSALAISGLEAGRASAAGDSNSMLKIFDESNDFLATNGEHRLASLLKGAKSEAWFIGTTFYISIAQHRDLVLSKLAEGIDLNFLILNPEGGAIAYMAPLLDVTVQELKLDCTSGIRVLDRTMEDARSAEARGMLRVKLIDEPFQIRFYLFDPRSRDGYCYFIPQVNGINSQTVPGFLVENGKAAYQAKYFDAVLQMWNDPAAQSLEEWKRGRAGF